MPESARVLQFPRRETVSTPESVARAAERYLAFGSAISSAERVDILADPDVLLNVVSKLRENVDRDTSRVGTEAVALYRAIREQASLGTFDERDYFLGETALLAAVAFRISGDRSETEIWLDRSEAGFRQTVNPAPLLANVTYQRLALRFEMGRYEEVIELTPMLLETYQRLGMSREQAKCLFLEACALKESGKPGKAIALFTRLGDSFVATAPDLASHAMIELGEMHVSEGHEQAAESFFARAMAILGGLNKPALLAHVKAVFGETLQRQGRLSEAISSYQSAVEAFENLGMRTRVAYIRLVIAQALLLAERPKEAEWQILAALPTIDGEKMLPEAASALALLAESARRRKLDGSALAQVRNYLEAKR